MFEHCKKVLQKAKLQAYYREEFTDGYFIPNPELFKDTLLSPYFEDESLVKTKRALDHWYAAKAIAYLLMG